MPIGDELKEALRSFAQIEGSIVELGRTADRDNALAMVNARRDLVMAFAQLGNALTRDPYLTGNPDKMTEGTRLFAAFRTQNSINQADWPAIRVRDNPQDYRASSQAVVGRSRAFWQWADQELGFRK